MTDEIPKLRAMVAKAAILSAVVSAGAIGLAYAAGRGVGNALLAHDIAMAGGILLLAGLPGLIGSVALTGRMRGGASIGFIAGIAVRLPVGGVLALYGLNWGLAKTQSFSQVIAAAYLVLLVIEVVCISPAVKRTAAAEARAITKNTPPAEQTMAGDEESV